MVRVKRENDYPEILRRAAHEYTKAGLWVAVAHIRIIGGKKNTSFKKSWQDHSTNDSDAFDETWGKLLDLAGATLVLDTEKSGLVVLDADGPDAIQLLENEWGLEPTASTPGGGRHYFYRARPDQPLHNSAKLIHAELDVRGIGGAIYLPPSKDDRGQREWLRAFNWDTLDPVPDVVIEAAAKAAKKKPIISDAKFIVPHQGGGGGDTPFYIGDSYLTTALDTLSTRMKSTAEGQRNDTLFKAGLELFRIVLGGYRSRNEVQDGLVLAADAAGLEATEIELTLDSAWRTAEKEGPRKAIDPVEVLASLNGEEDVSDETASATEHLVQIELARILVKEEAKRRWLGIQRPEIPKPRMLSDFLLEEDEEASYRVDRLWPAGGSVILAAQAKAGKTTMRDNLIRALVDGDPFLGEYRAQKVDGRVVVLDLEMPERAARRWFRDQKLGNTDQVAFLGLRGRETSFDLFTEAVMTEWIEILKELNPEVLILDCLGPWLASFGMNEIDNMDVGRALQKFRELVLRVGAAESLLIHHMGHTAERTRGASVLQGWPDALWRVVLHDNEKATADQSRYFSAYGRDVAEAESLLEFNPTTRHLTLDPERKDRAANRPKKANETPIEWVARVVADSGQTGITSTAMRAVKPGLRVEKLNAGIRDAETLGLITRKTPNGRWVKGAGQMTADYSS